MRMTRLVEKDVRKEKALIISGESTHFQKLLIDHLSHVSIDVTVTQHIPFSLSGFSYVFVIGSHIRPSDVVSLASGTAKVLVCTQDNAYFTKVGALLDAPEIHAKIAFVSLSPSNESDVEKVLWFLLSSSTEKSLRLASLLHSQPSQHLKKRWRPTLTRTRIVAFWILVFLGIHTLFILPMSYSFFEVYRAGTYIQDQNLVQASGPLKRARVGLSMTLATYALARPGLQFTFLSFIPENAIAILDNAVQFLEASDRTSRNIRIIGDTLTHKDASATQKQKTRVALSQLESDVATLEKSSQFIADTLTYDVGPIPDIREDFQTVSTYLQAGSRLAQHLDVILADGTSRKYVVYFYNNMEIRPGGGFIGSFAIVTFTDLTLATFEVYDVYDADGQLKVHVRPPAPIRDHLNQPHWFLRDSNFSPDFEINRQTAEFFLSKELNLGNFDGAIGMTTTSLTYLLEAFGTLHIDDFDETITPDNFYLKAQTYTESDFFPGSKQKKSFLSTVGQTLLLNMNSADPARFGLALKRSLDEKHMVFITKDSDVQRDIDQLGWSGKVLNPQCPPGKTRCIINHVLPLDANIGVNKANYFVKKLMKLTTTIQENGLIENTLSLSYTNTSFPGVFPGGEYKNYLQVYIPFDAELTSVEINGIEQNALDISTSGLFKIVGLRVDTPPQESMLVAVSYNLKEPVKKGQNTYQLVMQKQIGAFNTDFSFEIHLPPSAKVTDKNFKSVAKNNSVFYNSSLSTNKIFIIAFVKE